MNRPRRPSVAHVWLRQFRVLAAVAAQHRATVSDLADRLGLDKERVRQDLQALRAAGFPLRTVQAGPHKQRQAWLMDGGDFVNGRLSFDVPPALVPTEI